MTSVARLPPWAGRPTRPGCVASDPFPRPQAHIDQQGRREAYAASERREGLKANTIASRLKVLSAIYTFAHDDLEMPATMPRLKPSERPRPADDQRERSVIADDELAAVLAACNVRRRLYFRFVAETGPRKSEALGLTPRRLGVGYVTFAEQLADEANWRR